MDYTAHYQSPLGGITLGSDGDAIVGLWFDGQKFFSDTLEEDHQEKEEHEQEVEDFLFHGSLS